jgi:hypothetical protein
MADYEILKKVAEDTNFELNQLIDMYIAESSGRSDVVNPLGYVGGFQFGTTAGEEYNLVGKGFDYRKDLDKSARAAIKMFRNQTKPMSTKVDSLIKKRDLSSGLVGYLAHQQGRYGFQDIITAAESGNMENSTRTNVLANIGDSDWSNLSNKELADEYLKFWKKRYSSKVKEARIWQEKGKNIADRNLLNPDKAVMDSVPLPPN